ncbi:MAG: thioredoxin domain-containing protein [Rhodocyclales bacterium]|nr:thioredoxin domain-containing protein [Rhodocyclales bacterium]
MPDSLHNRLGEETSPYLRQHAANPVAWQPWDERARAAARRLDRPILLSVGYSACHWCHVMAHESFEDAAVAEKLNQWFVNIKVDREERPDLDLIYQNAHQLLTGRPGGWPLTMFLTPDGMPFFGGTYFPKAPRYGLPGFVDLCERVADAYQTRRAEIERQNGSLQEALDRSLPRVEAVAALDAAPLAAVRAALLASFDREDGGFGAAPKFPHATDLAFLLRQDGANGKEAAYLTLSRMAAGGIYDQLGGGFYRYSVDARWEIPHFEKMLYDNGPLLALYAEAWRQSGEPAYRRVAEETAEWLMRDMQAPAGGYYAALDADAEGEEGRYYVWQRDEVRALLTAAEWRVAERHWGLDLPPNFENRAWHLRSAAAVDAADRALVASARAKLLRARAHRAPPGRDEKILVSWNALTIAGMARAARILDRPAWLDSARRALDFIRAALRRDGRLLAVHTDGRAHLDAYLDDYAFLLAALLEAMQSRFVAADLAWAVELADALLERFEDAADGGFYFTAHDHEALVHRPKPAFDNALPAGNGIAACALQRLGHLLGETRYLDAAARTLRLFQPQLAHPGSASFLDALAEALAPPAIVLLRGPAGEVADWQHRLTQQWNGLCLALPNGLDVPAVLAKPESDRVNAWLCSGVSCLPPIAEFDELRQLILRRR